MNPVNISDPKNLGLYTDSQVQDSKAIGLLDMPDPKDSSFVINLAQGGIGLTNMTDPKNLGFEAS